MSDRNGRQNQRKELAERLWVRVLCGFLGAAMVFAIVLMMIQSFSRRADAVSADSGQVPDTADEEIAVGLRYGESAAPSFTLTSASGLLLTNRSGRTLFTTDHLSVDVCPDGPLSYVGDLVEQTGEGESEGVALTKPWHIQISSYTFRSGQLGSGQDNPAWVNPPTNSDTPSQEPYSQENVGKYIADLKESGVLDAYTDAVYPAHVNGNYYIRIGQFDSEDEAKATLTALSQYMVLRSSVVRSNGQGYTLLDGADHSVICEIVTTDSTLNVRALQGALADRDGKDYNGYLTFIRESEQPDRMRVINTFALEDYIRAILPGEISQDCPPEAGKAMAVILRTNAYRMLGRHQSDGFDVCTDHHCHVYTGASDVQSSTSDYVSQTAGQILLYDGKPIHAVYNVSAGNATVSAYEAFGTEDYPYLASVATPWEPSSSWNVELTSDTLQRLINSAGYPELETSVSTVSVDRSSDPSGCVSAMTLTDHFGGSVTLSGSEEIRSVFGGVLPGTNFTVTLTDGSDGSRYGTFLFTGSGSGSGIGYSLAGGAALAETGVDYAGILSTYYAGTTLLGGPTESVPPMVASAESSETDQPSVSTDK